MVKKNIHPTWFEKAKVYCNGELIMEVGATQEILIVDIWSGNHPYFTGSKKILDTEGRVERFYNKYSMQEKNN